MIWQRPRTHRGCSGRMSLRTGLWFLLIRMICLFNCILSPDKSHRTQTAAAAEPIGMFSKGLMQKQGAVPKQRCWDVYGHRWKVHQSWKSPPVPDVQPAHQTAEPAVSSHFRNIALSLAAHSSLLSSLTHTNKNKMSQMSAAWRDGVWKADKANTNEKQIPPESHLRRTPAKYPSFISAKTFLASFHALVAKHTEGGCTNSRMHPKNPAVSMDGEQPRTNPNMDLKSKYQKLGGGADSIIILLFLLPLLQSGGC